MSDESTVPDQVTPLSRKEQLAEARKSKAEKKRKRDEQLSNIESRLDTLLQQKESAVSTDVTPVVSSDVDPGVDNEEHVQAPSKKKIKITRQRDVDGDDIDADETEGWGPTIFRAVSPLLVGALSLAVQRHLASISANPIDNGNRVGTQPPKKQTKVSIPVPRVQKSIADKKVEMTTTKPADKPVGNSGFVV